MTQRRPQVILRLGSHAEKEYFEKLAQGLDAILFGGNLLEITPAATCSLVHSLQAKRNGRHLPYYLDPMTYCFGPYFDSQTQSMRADLNPLKSERNESRGSKTKIVAVKESYNMLARELGTAFERSVGDGRSCTAIQVEQLKPAARVELCRGVADYQMRRVEQIAQCDPLMRELSAHTRPEAIFAPYFYIHRQWAESGIAAAIDLAGKTAALGLSTPVHAIICASHEILTDSRLLETLLKGLPKTGVAAVWFWFDGFDELTAPQAELNAFRRLVSELSTAVMTYNWHGGYFSLLLSHDGLSGISHGVGYGERKNVEQVIGAAAPSVRYYLPAIRKRVGVPDTQRAFPDIPVTTVTEFFDAVCSCVICRGVIGDDLARFSAFGDMHRATPLSQRDTQTPTAAKLCRFHFLLNRMQERVTVSELTASGRAEHIGASSLPWRLSRFLKRELNESDGLNYLERWQNAFTDAS